MDAIKALVGPEHFTEENLPRTLALIAALLLIVRMLIKSFQQNTTTTEREHNSSTVRHGLKEGLNDYGGFTTPPDANHIKNIKVNYSNLFTMRLKDYHLSSCC